MASRAPTKVNHVISNIPYANAPCATVKRATFNVEQLVLQSWANKLTLLKSVALLAVKSFEIVNVLAKITFSSHLR